MLNTSRSVPLFRLKARSRFCFACILALLFLLCAVPCASAEDEISYTDQDTGLSFVIPDGWEEKPLAQERKTIDVKYMPTSASNRGLIMYGSYDMYAEAVRSGDANGLSRAQMTDDFLESGAYKNLLKTAFGMIGLSDAEFSSVTYGDVHWFCSTGTYIGVPQNMFLHIINGYCCSFQFMGMQESDPVIEQVLSSVTVQPTPADSTEAGEGSAVPAEKASDAQSTAPAGTTHSGTSNTNETSAFVYALRRGIVALLFFGGIPLLIVLLVRKNRKKQIPPVICVCPKCGYALRVQTPTCPVCGQPLNNP